MKRSTLPLAALFTAGIRADCTPTALMPIPSCAQPCFVSGAAAIRCGTLDFACQCRQQAGLYAAIESCVASSCAPSEFQDVIDGAAAVCECARKDWGVVMNPSHPARSYVSSPSPSPSLPPPSATPPPVTTTSSGNGGGGGASPTRTAPPSSTTSSATGAAARPAGSGLGFVCACAAAVGFAAL